MTANTLREPLVLPRGQGRTLGGPPQRDDSVGAAWEWGACREPKAPRAHLPACSPVEVLLGRTASGDMKVLALVGVDRQPSLCSRVCACAHRKPFL